MSHPIEAGLLCIQNAAGEPVGAGFLVAERLALTCAHVIDAVRGDVPGEAIVDFPLLPQRPRLTVRVAFLDRVADIAALELPATPPAGARPVRLVDAPDLWDHTFRAFGFPRGYDHGVWASGRILGQTANGWMQFEPVKTTGYTVQPGFSGSPLWDEDLGAVVGMIVAADRPEIGAAFGLPTKQLGVACPAVAESAIPPCPYRGLFAFRPQDAALFFGREAFTSQLLQAVQSQRFTAVVGPSGSGKSSVVFAGLLPKLDANWLVADFRPARQPFDGLAQALLPFLEPGLGEVDRLSEQGKLAERLRTGEVRLVQVIDRIVARQPAVRSVLFVADQFEELYTQCTDPLTCQRFVEVILETICAPPVGDGCACKFLITLRADFLGQVLNDRRLADALQNADLKLGPLNADELHRAIEEPARLQGVRFEAGLPERILEDVYHQPGALPLLEFALTLLWGQQLGGVLTHPAYDAIGQVDGALACYADEQFERLSSDERDMMQHVFVQLVHPGSGTEDTRRLAVRSELSQARWLAVKRLADLRLVTTSQTPGGEEAAEVIHEALIHHWNRLRGWVDADRAFRAWQERLRASLHQWQVAGHDEGALLCGVLLAEAEGWLARSGEDLGAPEQAYIRASADFRQRQENERKARQEEAEKAAVKRRRERAFYSRLLVAIVIGAIAFMALTAYPLLKEKLLNWQARRLGTLVAIKGGKGRLGNDTLSQNFHLALAEAEYTVGDFAIEKYEVTNWRYLLCVRAGKCLQIVAPLESYMGKENASRPVTNVSILQAAQFCQWIGRRLPTELEWEWAARHPDARIWPWGNSPNVLQAEGYARLYYADDEKERALCNEDVQNPRCRAGDVGQFDFDRSADGVYDLLGNVSEWTCSTFEASPDICWNLFTRWPPQNGFVVRGASAVNWAGSKLNGELMIQSAYRGTSAGGFAASYLGFRCVEERSDR